MFSILLVLVKNFISFPNFRYRDPTDGQDSLAWVTKLEPGYARQVFPCLDEPHLRANFDIKIGRPPGNYLSISNMPKVT
jgi:glutamyl aminopeptidase